MASRICSDVMVAMWLVRRMVVPWLGDENVTGRL